MNLNIFYQFSSEVFFEPLTKVEQKAWLLSKKLFMDQIKVLYDVNDSFAAKDATVKWLFIDRNPSW